MRLSGFILENIEPIVREWTDFARTLGTPGEPLDSRELKDHAEQMLRAIATDLRTDQSSQEQVEKSQGQVLSDDQTAAKTHAITRLMSGFTIDQVVSEFRALRASVIKQWMTHQTADPQLQMEDMIRFNEAIDQALAESISSYTSAVQVSRNIFLGILGHDLRTPLSAILLGADVLLRTSDLGARPTKVASRIYSSVKRASQIVGDLLDFTRSQIGPGIPLKKTNIDIQPICARIVDESSTVNPEADIRLISNDPVIGNFDGDRLEQVFSNLIGNAIQHGSSLDPVEVTLNAADGILQFTVHNSGSPIPEDVLPFIFNPMDRYSPEKMTDNGPYSSLGLGLFIVARIVDAHGGRIEVTSKADKGTTFAVFIPLNAE
ncbi:histidine kinase [Pseudomonas coronafaciens pv. porri]|uniref:histidine kinase n=1 Tax=Pseudomonas coronafaciens pv. porri TaxID=83964 RepID=A0ABR5JKF9_9PSED|nr:sensor histidine kinase [Pseudomonas coronafaciens]KOP54949.1 histidine kinase [Pseudomonas coronafaciens pv. porri]KOP55283.1 histidine kinase [Pseudomonas coronafaciens pv. porri]KPY26484.1 Sensor histidine kinase [Pseudomonas coronafaciens pv. porri]RMU79555.1 Sensor histidine kinase [Pseudomonas coronafaciens pv. porri]RMW01423.1 Sensor histidine kinase [Pseudomonas coronafaciens pv. porri]